MIDAAKVIGATLGVEVFSVNQHPSGAFKLLTSVGTGYLPDDLDASDREAVAEALTVAMTTMKGVVEAGELAFETPAPAVKLAKAPRQPKVKPTKEPVETAGGSDLSGPEAPEGQTVETNLSVTITEPVEVETSK